MTAQDLPPPSAEEIAWLRKFAAMPRTTGALPSDYEADRITLALIADHARLAAEVERLEGAYQAIAQHGVASARDFACAECRPHSEILVAGFQCAFHEATSWLRARHGCNRSSCVMPTKEGTHCRAAQGFAFTSDDWCGCSCHAKGPKP